FGGFGYGGFGYGGAGMRGGNGCGCEAAVATVGDIQRGFDNQGVTNKLNGLENGLADGFYTMNNSMLTGFNGVQSAIQNSAMNAMQNTFTRQQAIQADTVANMQNTNALATQFANCCCENRTGFQKVGYDLATQGNAIQVAIANQTQALMQNQNDNYRALHEEIVANRMEDMKTEMPICVARFRRSISLRVRPIRTLTLSILCVPARSLLILWRILSAAISRFPIRTLTAAPASAAVNSKWFRKGV